MEEKINKVLWKIMADIEPNIFMLMELSKTDEKTLWSYEDSEWKHHIWEEVKQDMIKREKLKIQAIIKWYMNDLFDLKI